jgi:hypothetical protein
MRSSAARLGRDLVTCRNAPISHPRLVHAPRHTAAPSGIRLHIREDPGLSVSAGDGVFGHLIQGAPDRIRTTESCTMAHLAGRERKPIGTRPPAHSLTVIGYTTTRDAIQVKGSQGRPASPYSPTARDDAPRPPGGVRHSQEWTAFHERAGRSRGQQYGRVWRDAREYALPPALQESILGGRPYDLRHTCVTTLAATQEDAVSPPLWSGWRER